MERFLLGLLVCGGVSMSLACSPSSGGASISDLLALQRSTETRAFRTNGFDTVRRSADLSCTFDFNSNEPCLWFNSVQDEMDWGLARLTSSLESGVWQRVTGRAEQPTDGWAGASTVGARAASDRAILKASVPCQDGNGQISLRYWMSSPNTILQVCTISTGSFQRNEQCSPEYRKTTATRISYTIPSFRDFFEIEIRARGFTEPGFVGIDDLRYDANICAVGSGFPDGASCTTNDQCQSRNCNFATCQPTSPVVQPKANGASCTRSLECQSNFCSGGVCVSSGLKANGASCSSSSECQSSFCTGGVCQGTGSTGASCSANFDCQSNYCPAGVCVQTVGLRSEGSTCSTDSQCTTGRCYQSICVVQSSLKRANGAQCALDSECQSSICDRQVCASRRTSGQPGDPCGRDADCVSTTCRNGVCFRDTRPQVQYLHDDVGVRLMRLPGEICDFNSQCSTNSCRNNMCAGFR